MYLSTTWTLSVAKRGEVTLTIGRVGLWRNWVAATHPGPWYDMMISVLPAESLTCMPCVMKPAATALKASLTLGRSWSGESANTVIVKSSKNAGIASLSKSSGGWWWKVLWAVGYVGS